MPRSRTCGVEQLSGATVRAIDTNVLARFMLNDDKAQAARAAEIVEAGIFIPVTVLLETAWLLTSRYRQSRQATAAALTALLDMPSIVVADEPHVRWALSRTEDGADFADMMHLVAAARAEAFATFDTRVAAAAGNAAPLPIETLA